MKRRLPLSIPLSIVLLTLLLGCAAVAGLISWKLNTRLLATEIENQFLEEAKLRITGLQAALEYHFRKGDINGVRSVISGLGTRGDVIAAYVVDEQDHILATTKSASFGKAADSIEADLPEDLRGRHAAHRAEVMNSTIGSMTLSRDRRVAVACYPLLVNIDNHALRSTRFGLMVLVLDTQIASSRAFHAAGRQARNHALVFGGLAACVWIFIHLGLTRRVAELVATTQRFAAGDLTARTGVGGGDELARLAEAFDLMADRIAEDIRRRKQVEADLRESEARFRQLAENVEHVFWMATPDGAELIYVSPAYERLWGRTCASAYAEPHSWMEAIVAEDQPKVIAASKRNANGETYDIEYRIVRSDGSRHWMRDRGFPVRDQNGKVVRICGIVEDITSRKDAENALQQSQRHLRGLIDGLGPSMFVGLLTTEGVLVEVNEAPLAAAGLKPEDVLGKPVDETPWWTHSADAQRQLRDAIARAARGEASRYDARIRGAGDELIDIDFSLQPLRDETGAVIFLVPSASVITERIRTEDALRESEKRFRDVFNLQFQFIAILSPEGRVQDINDLPLRAGGVTREEVTGQLFWETVWWRGLPDMRAAWPGRLEAAASSEGPILSEDEFNVASGEVRMASIAITAMKNAFGEVECYIVQGNDITDRKLADAALDASRQQLEAIINSVDGIVWEADAQKFQFTFVSLKAHHILGYPLERWITEPAFWQDHLHEEDRAWAIDYCRKATQELRSHEFEYRMLAADGREVWVKDIVTVIGENGCPVKLRGILVDITESKRAEALLRESETRLQVAIQSSNLGPWDWNLITNKVHFSPEWKRQLGYADEEIAGHFDEFRTRLHPEDYDRIMSSVQAFMKDRDKGYDVEFRLLHKDKSYRWIHTRATMLFDAADKPFRMLGCHLDITERKRAEAELENLYRQLLEASRHAGMAEVASSVLHNVGNVLNSVNVSAETVADRVRQFRVEKLKSVAVLLRENAADLPAFFTSDPRGRALPGYLVHLAEEMASPQNAILEEISSLRENVEHIKAIVAMQQNYARSPGISERCSVVDLVEDAIRINSAALTRHEVQLFREYDEVPEVVTDRHQVLQILVNLLGNAKYALEETSSEKRLVVRVTSNGSKVVKVVVADNGIGIAPENLTRIFQHGFTTKKDGHGFGLHSGALAAKALGGRLDVHSEGTGCGATFTLELPMQIHEGA